MPRIGLFVLALAALAWVPGLAQAQQNKGGPKANAAPDAKAILKASRSAILTMRTAMYNAHAEGYGLGASYPTYNAIVGVQRTITGSPVMAKVSVRGEVKRPGEGAPRPMHFVYDGETMRWLNPDGTLAEAPPGDGQADLLTREELFLVPRDLILDEPLTHIIDSGSATYEGRKSVEGTECDVVLVEYTPKSPPASAPLKVRLYIASDDGLPRRLEYPMKVGSDGGAGAADAGVALTLAQLQPNALLEPSMFKLAGAPPAQAEPKRPLPAPLKPRSGLLALGETAPDWALRDPEGKEHRLSDSKGKVVVLDFWATWCGPCKKVMPEVQALHEKNKDKNVVVLGVSTFERRDPVNAPAAYMKEKGYTYGLLVKGDEVSRAYGIEAIPTVYVIGPDGRVAYRSTGARPGDMERIQKTIDQQLRAKR